MKRNTETAEKLSSLLNDITFDAQGVAEAMCREHRTLQQTFTNLCLAWLKQCASNDYPYDGRNEASHIVAKQIMDACPDIQSLPFI